MEPWALIGDALLLFLLRALHGPVGVDLGCLLAEELVHLVVGLRDHLSGLGPAPLVACGCLYLGGGVDQGGLVPRCQVGQLYGQLSVLDDGISQDLLLPEPDIGVALKHLGVLGDIRASL